MSTLEDHCCWCRAVCTHIFHSRVAVVNGGLAVRAREHTCWMLMQFFCQRLREKLDLSLNVTWKGFSGSGRGMITLLLQDERWICFTARIVKLMLHVFSIRNSRGQRVSISRSNSCVTQLWQISIHFKFIFTVSPKKCNYLNAVLIISRCKGQKNWLNRVLCKTRFFKIKLWSLNIVLFKVAKQALCLHFTQ